MEKVKDFFKLKDDVALSPKERKKLALKYKGPGVGLNVGRMFLYIFFPITCVYFTGSTWFVNTYIRQELPSIEYYKNQREMADIQEEARKSEVKKEKA